MSDHSDRGSESEHLYRADIFLAGIGCFEMRQVTVETLDVLRHVRRVLHLTSQHDRLAAINPETEDLGPLYWRTGRDWDVYVDLARHVVEQATKKNPLALVVEGHPLVFNDICWEVTRQAGRASLIVQALPGVSCVDVLPILLGFDIGDLGVQIFEATQLVMYGLSMNPYLSTLILQAGEFSVSEIISNTLDQDRSMEPLVAHLLQFYSPEHPALFVRSKTNAGEQTKIVSTEISLIERRKNELERGMTLYLPRIGVPAPRSQ
jgi:precorrin-3B methylase